ncbi:MAG: imelysin family protein, partial [Pontibacterium sp.]
MTTTYPRAQTAFSYSLMVATAFISLSATPIANAAVPTEAQWDSFNKATLEHHVIPRYALLKSASSNLSSRAKAYCADQAPATKAALEQAFVQTLNAWQGIQHVNFGPVENNMYNFSMQYWPDKKNLTSKHLNALLTAQDPETLEPDYFRGASVTVKGLPALERLIFSDQMSNPFACKLGTAIASNVAHMADDIHAGWLGFGKARFDAALSGDDYYENATEAATDLLKSLVEPILLAHQVFSGYK